MSTAIKLHLLLFFLFLLLCLICGLMWDLNRLVRVVDNSVVFNHSG